MFNVKITTQKLTKLQCRNLGEEFFGTFINKKIDNISLGEPGICKFIFQNSLYAQDFIKIIAELEKINA